MGILSWWTGNKQVATSKLNQNPSSKSEEVPGMNGAVEVPRPAQVTVFEFGSATVSADKVTLAGYCPVSEELEPCRWEILPAAGPNTPQFRWSINLGLGDNWGRFRTLWGGSIVVESSRLLCGPAYFKIKNIYQFHSNFDSLEKSMRLLSDMKNNMKEELEVAEKDGKTRTAAVRTWLRKVEEIELSVSSIQAEVMAHRQDRHGFCLRCSLHYRLSREVVSKLKEVKQLMDEKVSPPLVMTDFRVKAVERLPGPSIIHQKTASQNLSMILDLLMDDGVGTLGMLGMGGVGKTTLIRNLNNELESKDSSVQPFSVVIWVTVSKDLDLGRIQDRLADRLNLEWGREDIVGKAIKLFNRLQKEKKFIVILDDVWEKIDLDRIGIPSPKVQVGSKIIVTTRSLDVCREMTTDMEFSVLPLGDQEAWELFSESAGKVVDSELVKPLAKDLTKECAGLPLAILTVGKAMRGKTKVQLWKNALRALRRSDAVPYIKGIEKEVFLPLKWSYNSLEGENSGPCFLFCCLYPEDFSIEIHELLQCWIAEGLIDGRKNHEEAYNMGIALIENLKDSCLLECGNREGTVMMHDVVRDVAIWIASSLECQHKSLIQSGFSVTNIDDTETWGSYKRVSFMHNSIEMLPDGIQNCSEVTTFLLQGNAQLKGIPTGFFQGFSALRVLNLSETNIESLPQLGDLKGLRVLLLRNCPSLTQLPQMGVLNQLQVLDVFGSGIKMEDLFLPFNHPLRELYVHFSSGGVFNFVHSVWFERLIRFTISIGFCPYTVHTYLTTHNERTVYLCQAILPWQTSMALLSKASALILDNLVDNCNLFPRTRADELDGLKSLTVENCSWTGSIAQRKLFLLRSLEILSLRHISDASISHSLIQIGRVRIIEIVRCFELRSLFTHSMLHELKSLEEIYVESCDNLMEIITKDCNGSSDAFPNIQVMKLKELPQMNCVCQEVMSWSGLKQIEVKSCPVLNTLPLSFQHRDTVEVIKGSLEWWNQIQWDNEDMKLIFQRYFQPL